MEETSPLNLWDGLSPIAGEKLSSRCRPLLKLYFGTLNGSFLKWLGRSYLAWMDIFDAFGRPDYGLVLNCFLMFVDAGAVTKLE